MRTIIAGSREGATVNDLLAVLAVCGWRPTVVLSGKCRGADTIGEKWAAMEGVPVESYPADWSLGSGAGIIRNRQMAEKAEALIALWDGQSRGTKSMIDLAKKRGLIVWVHRI